MMLKRIEGQEQEVVHALKRFAGGEVFLHLELTMGAYAKRRGSTIRPVSLCEMDA